MTADEIIARLRLEPHPEGGWYRQTWVADGPGRPAGTCIYFLLKQDEVSHWHRVDADEIWHYYSGASAIVAISETDAGPFVDNQLGPDIMAGQRPQVIVPAGHWQSTRTTGDFTLFGCTVSPGFQFEGFELAAPDFDIPPKSP